MSALIAISEIVRNLGLLVVAVFGLNLAWLRVTAANRQADANLSQAGLAGVVMWPNYSTARSAN